MATPARYYSSVAQQSTLTASITPSSTTIQLASTTGLPGSTPFTLSLDYGSANEELVDVTMVAALSLTVTRAVDGTSATSHNAGAVVRHVSSGRDFAESRAHEAATANVHGVVGAGNNLVGTLSTQTLSNKTLNRATGTLQNVDIFNVGLFRTTVVGDSANTTQTRLAILENEISLRTMAQFSSNGALVTTSLPADTDGTYRIRCVASDATTDRFAVLAGGTVTISPNATSTFVPLDIIAPDTSGTKRAFRVAASGGGTERFTIFNDGHVDITGTSTAFSIFDVQGPAAHASAYSRVLDSAGNTLWTLGASGKETAAATMDVRNDLGTGTVATPVLRVFGRNPGQTGDLTQWVDASNVIRCIVDSTGKLTANGLTSSTLGLTGALTSSSTASFSGSVTGGSVVTAGSVTAGNIKAQQSTTPAPGGTGGTSTVNVTFSTPMPNTPRVTITPNTTVDPATINIQGYVDNVTVNGFTIRCFRSSNSATNWMWIAVCD